MVWRVLGHGEMWNWYQRMDLKSVASQLKGVKAKPPMLQRARIKVWFVRVSSSILLWTCLIQLMALGELWHPHLPMGWPTCFNRREFAVAQIPNTSVVSTYRPDVVPSPPDAVPPPPDVVPSPPDAVPSPSE